MNRKHKLWKHYCRTRTRYNRSRYKIVKNELHTLTRKVIAELETNVAYNIKVSPKPFWSYVNSKMKTRGRIPSLTNHDGTKATEANDKAESLNVFFSSVFKEEELHNIPRPQLPFEVMLLNSIDITLLPVHNKLMQLKSGKSPSPDGWDPHFLKQLANLID